MKKMVVLMIFSLFVFGCDLNFLGDSSGEDICKKKPMNAKSWLCEAAAQAGTTLNTVDQAMLDASAVTVIVADIDIKKVEKFLNMIEEYLVYTNPAELTYTLLIEKMKTEEAKAQLVKSILSRRINMFKSDLLITPWDLYLIKLEIERQKEQFGIKVATPVKPPSI